MRSKSVENFFQRSNSDARLPPDFITEAPSPPPYSPAPPQRPASPVAHDRSPYLSPIVSENMKLFILLDAEESWLSLAAGDCIVARLHSSALYPLVSMLCCVFMVPAITQNTPPAARRPTVGARLFVSVSLKPLCRRSVAFLYKLALVKTIYAEKSTHHGQAKYMLFHLSITNSSKKKNKTN
jgi:hypothetical protein